MIFEGFHGFGGSGHAGRGFTYMNDVEMMNIHDISRIYEDFMDLEVWPGGWDLGVLPPWRPPAAPLLPTDANPRRV